jgi:hypothetical protein
MTELKLQYNLKGQPTDALAEHVERIYDNPGSTFLAVVEFRHTERVEYADEDREPSVKCRVANLEVARSGEQEQQVRSLLRALHLQRTAQGTLDDAGEVRLSKQTIELTTGLAMGEEVARLRTVLDVVQQKVHELASTPSMLESDLRAKVDALDVVLSAAMRGEQLALA